MFHLFFQMYVTSVFTWMLRMFCNIFSTVFYVLLQVFQKHVLSVSSVFRRMLLILHFDVLKVDRVLHMGSWGQAREVEGGTSSPRAQSGSAGDVGAAQETSGGTLAETCWHERVRRAGDGVQRGRPDASTYVLK
jgi:hypothetical protein